MDPVQGLAADTDRITPDRALVEVLRGRLEGLGPITPEALAAPLGLSASEIAAALATLEAEGFAMRGRFTPGALVEEWCERRLLVRIHHYTVKRLRAEIEPVSARDFLRFLLAWQHVTGDARMAGPAAVDEVVGQLEGFEAPAAAWETEILPARIARYEPAWLDERCRAGHVAWTRLRPRSNEGRAAPVRTTPITLIARRHAALWTSLSAKGEATPPTSSAQAVLDHLRQHGASFFDELLDGTSLLRCQVEDGLAELVASGLANSDSFGGLRALLVPSAERRPNGRRRRRGAASGMEAAGRWALTRRAPSPAADPHLAAEAVEHVARTLLRRYGVVFWRVLEREAAWLPPWRDLLRVYRRLESRGEVRGGRFVAGFAGEHFALPEAVAMLRKVRREHGDGEWVAISGADPLNLAGIVTPGPRLPALTGNRLLYRGGLPVATLTAQGVQFLQSLDVAAEWEASNALLRVGTARSLSPGTGSVGGEGEAIHEVR